MKTHKKHSKQNNIKYGKRNTLIGKCFHYDERGHWKKGNSHFLAKSKKYSKRGKYDLLLLESFIDVYVTSPWIVD